MASLCKRLQPRAGIWPWQMKTWARLYDIPNHLKPVATITDRIPGFCRIVDFFNHFTVKPVQHTPIEKKRKNSVNGIYKVVGTCKSSLQLGFPLLKKISTHKITSGFRSQHSDPCNPCGGGGSSVRDSSRSLTDKVIVITGGSEGIGYIIGDYYLKKKAKHVILLDVNVEVGCKNLNKLQKKFGNNKAEFMKCDVITDLNPVSDAIFCKYKQVDVLINNAGVLNEKKIKKTIDTNVGATIEWARKYWEHMRTDKGGKGGTIINLSSIYGFRINQFLPTYQASKFAMMGFTKALGHQYNYKKYGVRIMAICPGFTPTTLTSKPICWDETAVEDFNTFLKGNDWQKLKTVGQAAVDAFEYGDSGTAWLIEGGRPITEVVISARHDRPIKA